VKRNPLTGRKFRRGEEYLLHVAGGIEHIVPDTPEWRDKSIRVRITAIYHAGFWQEGDGFDEVTSGRRIGILDENFARPRMKDLRPPGRGWALSESSPEDPPIWLRRRDWELVPA
jgi:hypothetical protein